MGEVSCWVVGMGKCHWFQFPRVIISRTLIFLINPHWLDEVRRVDCAWNVSVVVKYVVESLIRKSPRLDSMLQIHLFRLRVEMPGNSIVSFGSIWEVLSPIDIVVLLIPTVSLGKDLLFMKSIQLLLSHQIMLPNTVVVSVLGPYFHCDGVQFCRLHNSN